MDKRFARQESIIRLILGDMAESYQFGMLCKVREGVGQVRGPKVHPADHAMDPWMAFREFKEPPGFLKGLPGLNGDGAVQSKRDLDFFEILWEPVSVEGGAFGDPGILFWVVDPEMLVGVKAHGIR